MKEPAGLPKALSYYSKLEYSTQQKVSVFYYLCIAGIVGVSILMLTSVIVHLKSSFQQIQFSILVIEFCAILVFILCLWLLKKGRFSLSAQLFLLVANIAAWMAIAISKADTIARIDTIFIILALVSAIPLLLNTIKYSIFLYVGANIILVIIFILSHQQELSLTSSEVMALITDSTIAFLFIGVVGFQILRINDRSLRRVEADNLKLKKAEEALKESELFRQNVFNSSKIPIVVMESETFKFIDINEAAIKKYGFLSREEAIGKTPIDVSAPKQYDGTPSSQKVANYIEKAINEDSVVFEWLHQRPNGEFWDAEVHLLSFESNNETLLQFSLVDITERKNAEKELGESKQLFETLAQVSPVGIFRTRIDGYTTYVNPKWTELSGLSFEEAIGDGWLNAVHPDDINLVKENWEHHSNNGKKSHAEYRFLRNDGSIIWVLGYAVPEIVDSEIKGFIGTITDITELKKVEKNLKESEERNRTIVEAFPDIIMISDLKKNIIFANDKLEEVTGITREDYTNPDRKARIHPDDSHTVQKAIVDLLKGDKQHTDIIENRFIDIWGIEHWFSGKISKMYINNEIVLQTITRDITKRKTVEKELEKYRNHLEVLVKERTEELAASNEELVSTNEELHLQREELEAVLLNLQNTQKQLVQAEKMASLGVLASGVAHEINNPLNFIKGGAFGIEQYMEENLKEHKDELLPLIEGINIGIDRAANIVKSLNHYNRHNDSNFIQCDIHSVLENCLIILRNQISKRITIEKDFTRDKYLLIGNEGKLHQAMLNILSNAVQSIEDKGFITIRTSISTKKMSIIISDSGCGISDQDLPKIFDPFFTTKDPGKGTGLGLSITYNILEEHSGSIDFESNVGEGTTAKIVLPLKKE